MAGKVISFTDLDVYQRLYRSMLIVMKEIIPILPKEERYGLIDQMRRCCKSPLAIIAEGYSRRQYKRDWQKYLNEAMGECNEMLVHLSCCRDIYVTGEKTRIVEDLLKEYVIAGKQLYRLGESWRKRSD